MILVYVIQCTRVFINTFSFLFQLPVILVYVIQCTRVFINTFSFLFQLKELKKDGQTPENSTVAKGFVQGIDFSKMLVGLVNILLF